MKPLPDIPLIDGPASSLILVECTGGSAAALYYFLKPDGAEWELDFSCDAFIGKGGPGKEREGDGKTPLGLFRAVTAFGIKPDPGTALPYLAVDAFTCACDSDCEWYNGIVDIRTAPGCSGEMMADYVPEYNYGMAIDYNKDNLYPLGSAVFFHCKGAKTWTGGCVAIDEALMRHILETCGKDPVSVIRIAGR